MPRIYPEGGHANIGDKRWEVEWWTMRPQAAAEIKATGRDFDPDADTLCHVLHFPFDQERQARAKAQEILDAYESNNLAYGIVTVTEQIVDWFVEEDGIAEWVNIGESGHFDTPTEKEIAATQ